MHQQRSIGCLIIDRLNLIISAFLQEHAVQIVAKSSLELAMCGKIEINQSKLTWHCTKDQNKAILVSSSATLTCHSIHPTINPILGLAFK